MAKPTKSAASAPNTNISGLCIILCRPQGSSQRHVWKKLSSRVCVHNSCVIDAVGFVGKVNDIFVEPSGVLVL